MTSQRSATTARFSVRPDAGNDLVHCLDAAHRADAAGGALAAGLDGAELEGEAGLLGHVHGVVEHHDAAMPDEALLGRHRLVVEGRVEEVVGEVGAERAADLDRADRPAALRAATEILDDLAQGDAEGDTRSTRRA